MTVTTAPHPIAALEAARERNETLWNDWHDHIAAGRVEEAFELWADDGRYQVVYPIEGMPPVIEGREALHAVFSGFAAALSNVDRSEVRFHQTLDPEVAIAEYRLRADVVDGTTYDNRLILRFTFRDGRFAEVVEYYGEIAHTALLRRLGAVS
jgi:ketosteroid isomerase-like protein